VLYILTDSPSALVAIQILDGIGAALFGVVSVLVIADLTQGSGRFNMTLGAVTTAVGIGAAFSQSIAGGIVHRFGYHAGFIFLATVAALALTLLATAMPETRDIRADRGDAGRGGAGRGDAGRAAGIGAAPQVRAPRPA
jgi:MFS family permease